MWADRTPVAQTDVHCVPLRAALASAGGSNLPLSDALALHRYEHIRIEVAHSSDALVDSAVR